jgi:ribonucleoside-diphosphate reductase alpha chain
MKINKIEKIEDNTNYWDITVQDTHNFMLENGSVVHNCGTGVGFSVESKYTNKLPEIPDELHSTDTTIVFRDSKIGWATGFREFLSLLYSGKIPNWDVSKIRPAGARLKTFGGRASGPEPLVDLLHFTENLFQKAKGRKLTTLECHDLVCKIADVVVSGGVRRSALISFSDLNDDHMRGAKNGRWWEQNMQRSIANNSAVYEVKPDIKIFMKEWLSLVESGSGERGIYCVGAAKNQAEKTGRRDINHDFRTNPCSEILLRPYEFCNLTEVIVRSTDKKEDLVRKVRIASILGTLQSTLTNFRYINKKWKTNTEEERLLGVSLTGIMDHAVLNGSGKKKKQLEDLLVELKTTAVDTNKQYAEVLGIPQSAAITCVKPSGTVSSLTDTAAGIHPRYAQYYIRRARMDKKDPLANFMINKGFLVEEDFYNKNNWVFSFPIKAPEGCLTRHDLTAIEQLEHWKVFQDHYTEHKPSITVYVNDHEWLEAGAWVYKYIDNISGVSFLPKDNGTYRQAPYEEITKEQYEKLIATVPLDINWSEFKEETDTTTGTRELACSAGVCEI